MRLFNEQVETMAKLKSKGGQQRVVVEHVTVAAAARPLWVGERAAVWSAHETAGGVSESRDAERALSDARRQEHGSENGKQGGVQDANFDTRQIGPLVIPAMLSPSWTRPTRRMTMMTPGREETEGLRTAMAASRLPRSARC